MKLIALQKLIEQYDDTKSWYRRIIDTPEIRALKAYITSIQHTAETDPANFEVKFDDFVKFAAEHRYSLNLTADYLNSDAPSARIFNQWKTTDSTKIIFLTSLPERLLSDFRLPDFDWNYNSIRITNLVSAETFAIPKVSLAHKEKFISDFILNKKQKLPQIDTNAEAALRMTILLAHRVYLEHPESLNTFFSEAENSLKERCLQSILRYEITKGKPLPDHLYLPIELQNIIFNRLQDFTKQASPNLIPVPLAPFPRDFEIGTSRYTDTLFHWGFYNSRERQETAMQIALAALSIADVSEPTRLIGSNAVMDPPLPAGFSYSP